MPFQYTDSRAPAAGSIAELMLRRGDIAARQAEQIGAANARAAEVSGNAYAGAVQGIGNAVSGAIQQATDPRRKMEALQVTEAQKALSEADALKAIIRKTPKVDLGDGTIGYDVPTIADAVTARGGDPAAVAQHLGPLNQSFQQIQAVKLDAVKRGAQSLIAAGNDPELAHDFLDMIERNHVYPPAQVQRFRDLIAADPANVAKLTAALAGPAKIGTAAPGSSIFNETTGAIINKVPDKPVSVRPGSSLVNPESGAVVASVPQLPPQVNPETARHNQEMERIAGLTAGRQEAAQKETERHNRASEAQGEAAPTLSPEATDLTAKQFAMTGQLPPMGMGKQGAAVRTSIINRAAELYKGLDLPSQVAAFKANKDSLVKLQGQRDAISAFEQTASKNIDIFLDAAGKVVDTGSPMANSLVRQVSGKMLGSPDQAAYDAARQVAVNEIAKITSNPNLSGTLSDSARHEIEQFNPQSATLAQSVKVMRLLKQDMANRATSMDDQIKAVQQRIATPPGGAPSVAPKSDPLGLFGPPKK